MLYFNLDHASIANGIAELINNYNNLGKKRVSEDILHGKTDYVVELHGKWVLGAVGIDRQSYTFTEIKHLVVHPDWRGKGLAKMLVQRAIKMVTTRMVYCTVREDNAASLALFRSCGFETAGEYPAKDHKVVILARVAPQWQHLKTGPKLKSSWLDARSGSRLTSTSAPK